MANPLFDFDILADMPGAPTGVVNESTLHDEIGASAISPALLSIRVDGNNLKISFASALSAGEVTILFGDVTGPSGGLLAAHDNSATPEVETIVVEAGQAGGFLFNFAEYTTDPTTPIAGDLWIRNTASVRRLVFYDGTNKHAVILTQE